MAEMAEIAEMAENGHGCDCRLQECGGPRARAGPGDRRRCGAFWCRVVGRGGRGVGSRVGRYNRREFKVRWEGWTAAHDSWLPGKDILDKDLIAAYDSLSPEEQGRLRAESDAAAPAAPAAPAATKSTRYPKKKKGKKNGRR